ncbi:sigma-70 family RNA polymerase sigma factor [Pseudoflavitalea sp. G-6-1-2]|uniref:RNA polymerase sigma factor n=1 Tax=Pseudoflavitalea sp. G-6-1-2 TaxID=2728841 RepID=UPI00146B176D|nr:sigma-70 family RNA polymerase sigma factor [Pseudoflavitalea sp. G-6-1-2]NML23753.1 sigma-70 family RNA polymerase sigma factor [Pseudoflavitalea sp. G-6-1-2]
MVYSDDELLQLYNDGTDRGFNGVYEKFWLQIYHYVLRLGLTVEDAKDITADTFIKLFKKRKTFDQLQNIYAYLLTTARNGSFDFVSRNIRMGKLIDELEIHEGNQYEEEDPQTTASYNEEVVQETIRAVLEEIEKLPNQCRTIFMLAFLHGKSNPEIAAQLNIQEKTVRNQKHKARQHLRMTIPLRNWLKCWATLVVMA